MLRTSIGTAINERGALFALLLASQASTLALSLFFTSATVNSSGGVTDVDGTGNALTYTGASHKRQWNADGVLEYAPHNILINSEDFSTGWTQTGVSVTSNAAANPLDGALTADLVTDTTSGFSGSSSCLNKTYTAPTSVESIAHSVYIKAGTTAYAYVEAIGGAPAIQGSYIINLTTQAIHATTIAADSVLVEDAGDGWCRVTITDDTDGDAGNPALRIGPAVASGSMSATESIYIWGAQVRRTPSPDTYIATTSSAVYGPRVGTRNRKPVTNLLSYPEQMNVTPWLNLSSSLSSGQADPFGGTNANKFVEASDVAAQHLFTYLNGIPFVSGKTYTYSAYFKAGERTWVRLNFSSGQFTSGLAYFNLSTGEIGTVANLAGQGIAPVEGAAGWYRCWITATATSSGQTTDLNIHLAEANNDITYDGDGSSGLYIFGAQLNEGGIEDYIGARNRVSNDKDITAWTNTGTTDTGNTVVAPDGTTTGDTLTASAGAANHHIASPAAASTPANQVDNASVFIKKGTHDYVTVSYITDASSSAWIAATIDFTTNTITKSQAGASATLTSSSITYWGNGWYRVELVGSLASTGSRFIKVHFNNSNNPTYGSFANESWTAAGTETVYIWGAQLTKGSTLYPYVGMPQTGFTKQGYLAEAAATNLVTDSEAFGAASWTTVSATITANETVAPDGTTTADTFADNGGAGLSLVYILPTLASSTNYVFSGFVKSSNHDWILLNCRNKDAVVAKVWLNLLTGAVGTTSGASLQGAGAFAVGNGWHRLWISFSSGTSATAPLISFALANADAEEAGATASGDAVFLWGAQLETGTYPSSYIRTSGGTATRATDILSTTDLSWYIGADSTFVADLMQPNVVGTSDNAWILYENASNYIRAEVNDSDQLFIYTGASIAVRILNGGTAFGVGTRNKVSSAFDSGTSANGSINGGIGTEDTSFTLPSVSSFGVLVSSAFSSASCNTFIRSLQYYSERKSDADLATLSTITDDGTTWRDDLA